MPIRHPGVEFLDGKSLGSSLERAQLPAKYKALGKPVDDNQCAEVTEEGHYLPGEFRYRHKKDWLPQNQNRQEYAPKPAVLRIDPFPLRFTLDDKGSAPGPIEEKEFSSLRIFQECWIGTEIEKAHDLQRISVSSGAAALLPEQVGQRRTVLERFVMQFTANSRQDRSRQSIARGAGLLTRFMKPTIFTSVAGSRACETTKTACKSRTDQISNAAARSREPDPRNSSAA